MDIKATSKPNLWGIHPLHAEGLEGSDAKPVTPQDNVDQYMYERVQHTDSIRIAELLPAPLGDPIHILLHQRSLEDLPSCAAVSYEWGSNTRQHSVFCERRKINVTKNLYNLLQNLRTEKKSQLLWIDAICINQEDLAERSQQVSLMSDIYHRAAMVLIWIGNERAHTGEAMRAMSKLADSLNTIRNEVDVRDMEFRKFKTVADIRAVGECVSWLSNVTNEPSWRGVVDLLSTRTYFTRLWVVQEIVLSSNATVICGKHELNWKTFNSAACLVWMCTFLQGGVKDFLKFGAVVSFGQVLHHQDRPLSLLLTSFSEQVATDPRDYVYALLGMLSNEEQKQSFPIDYTQTPQTVFQDAMESVIKYEQSLSVWSSQVLGLESEPRANMPSWVVPFDSPSTLFIPGNMLWIPELFGTTQMSVEHCILTVRGLLIDTVEAASLNISDANANLVVIDTFAHYLLEDGTNASHDVSQAARRTFNVLEDLTDHRSFQEQDFFSLLSWMILPLILKNSGFARAGHTERILQDLDEKSTEEGVEMIRHWYKRGHTSNISESIPAIVESDTKVLEWIIHQNHVGRRGTYHEDLFLNIFDESIPFGRNVFRGKKSYSGLGPAGRNDVGEDNDQEKIDQMRGDRQQEMGYQSSPANRGCCQVGDRIAFVTTVPAPVILRPNDDGTYCFVGAAYVTNLGTKASFLDEKGGLPETVILQIR